MGADQKIVEFWNWFKENNHKYLFLNEVDDEEKERLLDEFLSNLHELNEHFYFEIGGHPDDDKVELIISAEGARDYFEDVENLVAKAPELEDWRIIAFKPPMGPGFKTNYGGREFDPDKIIFIPLYSQSNPNAVGFNVCYPDYNEDDRKVFLTGTFLMIDTLIGEKSAALDIDYLDVVLTPEDIGDYEFKHLCDLKEFIEERKNGG